MPNFESGFADLGAALAWVFFVVATISAGCLSYFAAEAKPRRQLILFSIISTLSVILALLGVFLHGLYDTIPGINR